MKPCYRLYLVLFSWGIFTIFPSKWRLGEQEDRFEGFAVDWLGFEFAFEKLKEVGCQLKTKEECKKLGVL